MRKIRFIFFGVLYISMLSITAQGTSTNTFINETKVPYQEQVYLKTNTSLGFVGEYLYYTIYNLKAKTGQLSGVSKIAYLKLVNENGNIVLNHKIKLNKGIGDSNFFIPSNIPSGNYKLVAYTQWMLNNGKGYFFSQDLTIINPYTSDQAVFRQAKLLENHDEYKGKGKAVTYGSIPLEMQLDKNTYGIRDSIHLELISKGYQEGLGNYVISVRRVNELKAPENLSVMDYQTVYPSEQIVQELILPELRGELISGKVSKTEDAGDKKEVLLAASFPGEDYLLKIVNTDDNGEFFVNVDKDYTAQDIYLQPLGGGESKYDIVFYPEKSLDFSQLNYHSFKLDKEMEPVIKERSIHNQIENAYYSSKPDTILLGNGNARFYGPDVKKYVLDEYTRFSTVKETFVEIVEHVWLQADKNGEMQFHVRPEDPYVDSGQLPLVIVDGILVLDHGRLLNLPSNRINTISISRNNHFYGTKTFQGVVDITTFKNDYFENYYTDNLFSQELFKPNESKNYYRQSYQGAAREKYDRLPDFRYQLLWLPKYQITQKVQEIDFYSSDIKGEFEVVVEGFTLSGKPVLLTSRFTIE